MRIKHNHIVVHVINEEKTNYVVVLVSINGPYVEYSLGDTAAIRAVSNLMVHQPNFLDRKYSPLWCNHKGKYISTKGVPFSVFQLYLNRRLGV